MTEGPAAGNAVAGVVLAGGRSRRMGGGDKSLRRLAGRPLLAHVVERARPQVEALVLNANGDPSRFADYGLEVVPDEVAGHAGPLAGVLAGLSWAADRVPGALWLASFACDAPFFPTDLVDRLLAAVRESGADMACAASGGRAHPVFGLWPVRLLADLRRAVAEEGIRKVDVWTGRYRLVEVEFPLVDGPAGPVDPFFNANRPEDLAAAEAVAAAL